MALHVTHTLLVNGKDLAACRRRVLHFFATTQLVHYDQINILGELSCPADAPAFQGLLNTALQRNQDRTQKLLAELQANGYSTTFDLLNLPQGFLSKTLHTIAHMKDGFFGIDAAFFDLDNSSCQLSERRQREIQERPEHCWLLTIEASSSDKTNFEHLKGEVQA